VAKKAYTEEFKRQAARLINEHGYSHREASGLINVDPWTIRAWAVQFPSNLRTIPGAVETKVTPPENLTAAKAENQCLRNEIEWLRSVVDRLTTAQDC